MPATIIVAVRAVRTLTTAAVRTPGTAQRHLGTGTWVIFEQTGTTTGVGFTITHDSLPDLAPAQVSVAGPAGPVPVSQAAPDQTITRGSRIYTSALEFHVASPGTYEVRIDATSPGEVLISRSLSATFRGFLALAAAGSLGGLLVLTGIVLLIVGAARRSRARATPVWSVSPGLAPPGWYPDPQLPGYQRWWDGSRWTEQRA